MRAYEIIRSGGFGPEDIERLDVVFANAWRQLSRRYAVVHGESRDEARERLARIVVGLGKSPMEDSQLIATVVAAFDGSNKGEGLPGGRT